MLLFWHNHNITQIKKQNCITVIAFNCYWYRLILHCELVLHSLEIIIYQGLCLWKTTTLKENQFLSSILHHIFTHCWLNLMAQWWSKDRPINIAPKLPGICYNLLYIVLLPTSIYFFLLYHLFTVHQLILIKCGLFLCLCLNILLLLCFSFYHELYNLHLFINLFLAI